jgi:purine nucleoside phosphorylase
VPEVIVAIHSRMRVLALSAVTNLSNIFHSQPHSQEDIRYYAGINQDKLETIINKINLKP